MNTLNSVQTVRDPTYHVFLCKEKPHVLLSPDDVFVFRLPFVSCCIIPGEKKVSAISFKLRFNIGQL